MNETIDSIHDLIFALEYSLRLQESEIRKMDYYVAKRRYKQLMQVKEEQKKEMEKAQSSSSASRSASRPAYRRR